MRQALNMQFVSKIKCCSPTYTRIHWEFLRLITRSRDPSRHNTLARAEAHTHSHSHTGRHSNERLKAHKQTARRRSDVGSIGTCVWCVCKYVCMLACNSACVQVCVCVCVCVCLNFLALFLALTGSLTRAFRFLLPRFDFLIVVVIIIIIITY